MVLSRHIPSSACADLASQMVMVMVVVDSLLQIAITVFCDTRLHIQSGR
jgi:hypothetical protein